MALVSVGRIGNAFVAMGAAVVEAVDDTGPRIHKDARARDDLCFLRRGDRDLDNVDPEQRRVGVFSRFVRRAAGELIGGTYKRGSRDIYIYVVGVVWIGHQRV